MKLQRPFYARPEVEIIAQELLGKYLFTQINGVRTGGIITETEAYSGTNDKACHSNNNKRTPRTEVMFGPPGFAYVYLIYGIYSLFNVVTNEEGKADAVLIRAIEPTDGVEEMLLRRNLQKIAPNLTSGPGLLAQALGITTWHYGTDLTGDQIWIEDRGKLVADNQIIASPRVGVAYAQEDALRPWRFRLKGSLWTSRAK